jgi:hypothetical protein
MTFCFQTFQCTMSLIKSNFSLFLNRVVFITRETKFCLTISDREYKNLNVQVWGSGLQKVYLLWILGNPKMASSCTEWIL